jgi:tight adherence protein B
VVTAVLIQTQVGGNLAEVLETIAETVRDRARIQGQVRVLTAQGRLSGWVIGLLPPALALVLAAVSPGYLAVLWEHPLGRLLLGSALAAEGMGLLFIRRIVQVEA